MSVVISIVYYCVSPLYFVFSILGLRMYWCYEFVILVRFATIAGVLDARILT